MTAGIARHDAEGFWVEEAGPRDDLPALSGAVDADVVVIGGGYTGLWTAWQVVALEPGARVVVLEAGRCGTGPSGRNGGFVNSLWYSLPRLAEAHGTPAALELCRASAASVRAIGAWCADEEVDAWYRPADHLQVSTGAAQDGAWDETAAAMAAAGVHGEQVALNPSQVQARCASPVLRGGAAMPTSPPCSPPVWRSGCASGCARGAWRSSSPPGCGRCGWAARRPRRWRRPTAGPSARRPWSWP
jgi:glycine/D-amino acid oxidase-like deaminating enzyme